MEGSTCGGTSATIEPGKVKRVRCGAAIWLLSVILLWSASDSSPWAARQEAADRSPSGSWTVIRVYDGDTVLVRGEDGSRVVRLLGIDAPETPKASGKPGQPYSRKARRHLAGLILNRTVALAVFGEDRYHRLLAVIYRGEEDVNHAMIRVGLAEVYRGRTPAGFDKAPYQATEEQARREQRGMWRQGEAYVSPIRWKHPR